MKSSDAVIQVRGLGKRFRVLSHPRPTSLSDRVEATFLRARARAKQERAVRGPEEIWALRDASFDVARGEVLGVIGPNGAGKSTLLSILARITEPTEGRAEIAGRVSSILEVGTGFHPELSGRDNIFLNGTILGMSRSEIAKKFDEIVEFSGVAEFIDMPVKRYSSGMYVRLAFAVTAHLDPDVLLLDEVLAVGDRGFQEKCHERVRELTAAHRTVLFVSHDVTSVERLCERAIVIVGGKITYSGAVHNAIAHYLEAVTPDADSLPERSNLGVGPAQITAIQIENDDGSDSIVAEEPLSIRTDVEARGRVPWNELELELELHDSFGTRYVVLSRPLAGERPLGAGAGAVAGLAVTCRLEELPLRPGEYTVSGILRARGEVIDRVSKKGRFRIVPSDFFGTGTLVDEDLASPVLTRQRWSVATCMPDEYEATEQSDLRRDVALDRHRRR